MTLTMTMTLASTLTKLTMATKTTMTTKTTMAWVTPKLLSRSAGSLVRFIFGRCQKKCRGKKSDRKKAGSHIL